MYYNGFIDGCLSVETREFARVLQMPNYEDISQIKMNKSYCIFSLIDAIALISEGQK